MLYSSMPDLSPSRYSGRALYLRLLTYVRPHWKVFALAVLSMVLVGATEPLFPALLKPMLDGSFAGNAAWHPLTIPLAIVGVFVLRGMLTFLSSYTLAWVSNRVVMDLRNAMFGHLVRLPTRFFDDQSSGVLLSRVAYDVNGVTDAATSVLTVLVKDTLAVLGLFGWLFYLNWKLTLIALAVIPSVSVVVRLFSGRLREMSRGAQRAVGNVAHVLEETIECHKVVKLFGGEGYEVGRFRRENNALRGYNMRQTIAAASSMPMVQLLGSIALAVIVYIAIRQSQLGETTIGAFVSFITAMLMLLSPLKRLTDVNVPLQRGLAAAESVFALLDEPPETDRGTRVLGRVAGRIEFERVSFSYPTRTNPALDAVSLTIAPGERVALVGASGSGKTTLANLVPRFYEPNAGRILVDGEDVGGATLASLRANIALVSQDVVLFNDSIAANIAYGARGGASEAEIVAAAEAAHAMEFIRETPEGLKTLIGENGLRLSGGQRQRLGIARALLKDAPILILDEATSALDSESERLVQAALETLMKNRTTLVIAHRLSTIENADRILVLARGRVVEAGRHAELLAGDGVYARLYRIQFALDRDEALVAG